MATHGKLVTGAFVSTPVGGRVKVVAAVKGAMNECVAAAWLMSQGYDVFKNVAPVGRADLVAKNWDTGELIFVDVKSQAYDPVTGNNDMSKQQREQVDKYKTSDIKYLVVNDDGSCQWYGENKIVPLPDDRKYWIDPKSGQSFLHPLFDMKNSEWKTFCFWMLECHRDKLTHAQFEILENVRFSVNYKRGKEVLQQVRVVLYRKITGLDVAPTAVNDNIESPEAQEVAGEAA